MAWDSVIAAFVPFSRALEGWVQNPYLDVKGLLTVGMGNLIDPPTAAAGLPWVFVDGTPAPAAEVLAQLRSLKAQPGLANYSALSPSVKGATTIRLTDDGIASLCHDRMIANEVWYVKAFPSFATWPADAQLACHSMGWAVGAGWPAIFGNCSALLKRIPPAFLLAAVGQADAQRQTSSAPCDISTGHNAGVIPRNAANRLCFTNAQLVLEQELDPSVLYWPNSPLTQQQANI